MYKRWLAIGGVCATLAYTALLVHSVISGNYALALFCAAVVACWWASYRCVREDRQDSLVLSLLAVVLAWLPMRWLFLEPIRANSVGGEGSPLAFAVAPVFGLLILLPVTATLAIGVYLKISETIALAKASQPRTVVYRYQRWLLVSGVIVSCVYGYFLIGCLMSSWFGWAAFCVGLITFWWLFYKRLEHAHKHSIILTLLAVLLAWLPMAWLLAERIRFMKRSGFEGPNGEGSPLAFLIGLTAQLVTFFPVTVTLVLGLCALVYERMRFRKSRASRGTPEQL